MCQVEPWPDAHRLQPDAAPRGLAMRLAVITNDFPPKPGGIQQYLGSLVDAYPHPVLVLGPSDSRARADPSIVRHHSRFMWPTRAVGSWAERELKTFGAEVIVFGAPYPLARLGPRLSERLGIPYTVLAHGAEVTVPAAIPGMRQWVAGPMRRASARLAVSNFTARAVGRMTRRPVDVIGTGVDTAEFVPSDQDSGVTIGCVSRFVPRKGQQRLIKAAAELVGDGRELELLFVGKGRTEKSLRSLADRAGVLARFEVDVPWDRLGQLYREMDIFAMPCKSRWLGLETEGFGLVYLEAAAAGLPVIAGDSGGAPETVVPGRTGFVVSGHNGLVEALDLLLTDQPRGRLMGQAGRERVLTEFTWDRTVDRLLEVLRRVVDPK